MKARIAWYALTQWAVCEDLEALTQWAVCEDLEALSEAVGVFDRSAFWLAVIGGIAGLAYISSRRTPATFHPSYRRQLDGFLLLCTIATGGIVASVICDGFLTALRLSGWEMSVDFLIPIFSRVIEVVCADVLVLYIHSITQRMASTATLLRT